MSARPGQVVTPSAGSSLPATRRGGCLGLVGMLVGALYLTNPTAGTIELIPDVLPIIGNLDEAFFTGLLLWGLRRMGVDALGLFQREFRQNDR